MTKKDIFNKTLILFLKVGSMGIKFVFFSILLPKEMEVTKYGDISLLITTITFFIFIIGFDFYNYTHRDFINDDKGSIAIKIYNQFVFNSLVFIAVIPLFHWAMKYNDLPFIEICLLLLFTEYFGQELYRLLIVFSKPILGNVILFFRSSFWIIALIFFNHYSKIEFSIFNILLYWIIGNSVLFIITLFYSLSHNDFNVKKIRLNYSWIKKGIKVSVPFFLSTVALKTIELSDRYVIKYFFSNEEVGVYSFYSNVSNSLNVFISTSVVIMMYPKILKSFKNNNIEKSKKLINTYKKEMILFLILFSILIVIFINPLIGWVGKVEYSEELSTFWVLLFSSVLFNLSLIPHVILYSLNKDKKIIIPVIWAAVINLISNIIFVPYFGILGAGISTFLSFLIILSMKYYSVKKINF
jgi:O-antigen/teichoic acid export membrane protein